MTFWGRVRGAEFMLNKKKEKLLRESLFHFGRRSLSRDEEDDRKDFLLRFNADQNTQKVFLFVIDGQ